MISFLLATWVKLNTSPVCFGAKDGKFGTFSMPFNGNLAAIRLGNLYGYVTCDHLKKDYWSYWGCGSQNSNQINVVITDEANTVVLPEAELILDDTYWAIIPGFNSVSYELVLSFFKPIPVDRGQEFRVWYGEDLTGHTEDDNSGSACIDVYALKIVVQ